MHFDDYTDPHRRYALRELRRTDLAGLEFMDRAAFFPYLRHVKRPKMFLDEALAAQSARPRTHYIVGIFPPDRGEQVIGIVGAIADAPHRAESLDVGYCLVPAFQKRGIARAAFKVFLARILTSHVVELTATVDPENAPSIRLLEACGFERSGVMQTSKYLGDPANPSHYEGGTLLLRPRVEYRAKANTFRKELPGC